MTSALGFDDHFDEQWVLYDFISKKNDANRDSTGIQRKKYNVFFVLGDIWGS